MATENSTTVVPAPVIRRSPWRASSGNPRLIVDNSLSLIATATSEQGAKVIIDRVEAHDELVAALRMAETALTMKVQGQRVRALRNGNDSNVVDAIRAALAKVQS